MGAYLAASLKETLRGMGVWALAAAGLFLLWVGVTLDILAIEAAPGRIWLLGWGTVELVSVLATLARASQVGGAPEGADLDDAVVATRLGPHGLLAGQWLSAVGRGVVVGIPTIALTLVDYMHSLGSASGVGLGGFVLAVTAWLLVLGSAAAWGLALGRAVGVAGGFLASLALLVLARSSVLPAAVTGLLPPPLGAGLDALAAAATLLATSGCLAAAAAMRAR
jgi:hypothetical protein